MKLVDVPTYRELYHKGRVPDPRTVRRWIRDGILPGEKRGRLWYVDVERIDRTTGNVLADMVLSDEP